MIKKIIDVITVRKWCTML